MGLTVRPALSGMETNLVVRQVHDLRTCSDDRSHGGIPAEMRVILEVL